MTKILKKIFTSFVILSFLNSITFAQSISNNALPTNPTISSGSANISQTTNKLTVNQNTDKLITNWSSFNIGKDATVQFVQPSSTSSALNRVTSSDPSYIFGTLQANGKIILVNPNGVLFANGAKVDVGSIIASTLKTADKDFLSDQLIFEKDNLAGTIQNDGTIRAFAGGTVALIGSQVTNNGKIKTKQGTTALLAGDKVTLTLNGNRLIKYNIDEGTLNSLVENNNAIIAKEGVVILSAKALNLLSKSSVNNTGNIEAKGFSQVGGKIYLDGDQTTNSGKLVASSKNNSGGLIQVTGEEVKLTSTASLDASGATGGGTVLVGGDYQGKNPLIKNANLLNVEQGSYINVDATLNGDGGKAIFWADKQNNFEGQIFARGGVLGGNGGFAEVSSKGLLNYNGITNTLALLGITGTLLLDPTSYFIGTSTAAADSTHSILSIATLNTNLSSTNQTITASNDIDFAGDLSFSGSNTSSLILDAPVMVLGGSISVSGTGKLNVNLGNSKSANNLWVSGSNRSISTNNGTISVSGNIGGAHNLTLNSGTAATTLNNATGNLSGTYWPGTVTTNTITSGSSILNYNPRVNGDIVTIDFGNGTISASGGFSVTPASIPNYINTGTGSGGNTDYDFNGKGGTTLSYKKLNDATTYTASITSGGHVLLPANTNINYIQYEVGSSNAVTITAASTTTTNTYDSSSINTSTLNSLDVTSSTLTAANITLNSNNSLSITNSGAGSITGVIAGSGATLTKAGAGTLTLSGTNTYTGATTVSAGTLAISADANLGTAPGSATAGQLALNGGTLQTTAAFTLNSNRGISLGTGGGTINTNTDSASTLTYGGIIAGSNGLTKSGSGKLTLSGANTYSGSTTLTAGSLLIGNAGSGSVGSITNSSVGTGTLVFNGGTISSDSSTARTINNPITYTGNVSFGDGTNNGALTFAAAEALGDTNRTLTANTTGGTTLSGIISGNSGVGITKSGLGTLTLSENNTYSGITNFNQGILAISSESNLGATPASITANSLNFSNGTLQLTGSNNSVSLNSNRGVTINSGTDGVFNISSTNTLTIPGVITGAGTLYKQGLGTLSLTGTNTYTGNTFITIGGGIFQIGSAGSLNSGNYAGTITLNGSGTGGSFKYSSSADQILSGLIKDGGSYTGTSLTKDTSSSSTLTLSGTNTYNGNTAINAGTIAITNGSALGGSSSGQGTTVASGATLGISGGITAAEPITISGTGASGGAINFTGGNNTYSGSITLAADSTINSTSGQQTISSVINGTNANSQALTVTTSDALTLSGGSVGQTTSLSTFNASTTSGNLTLGENIKTGNTGSSSIVLNAGSSASVGGTGSTSSGNIIISGSPTLTTGSGGSAKLFTGSIADSTGLTSFIGSGSGKFRYNSDETTTNYTTALSSGNYAIYRQQPTATITANNQNITYGDTVTNSATVSSLQNGDSTTISSGNAVASVSYSTSGSASNGNYDAGVTHTITPSSATGGLGYAFSYSTGSLTVGQKALTIGSASADNKIYDGTDTATINSIGSLSGFIGSETVTASATSGTFSDKNVANGKTVSVAYSLSNGSNNGKASNYSLANSTTTANITAKALTASGLSGVNKTYDGTTTASLTGSAALQATESAGAGTTSDGKPYSVDSVSISGTATGTFTDRNVADARTINISGLSLTGTGYGNYTLTAPTTSANITAKALTASISSASSTYGSTTTPGTLTLTGIVESDSVSGSAVSIVSPSYSTSNNLKAGTYKQSVTSTLSGTDAGNYTLTGGYTTTSNNYTVNAKPLSVSGLTADNKVYDGTTDATITGTASFSGTVGTDVLSVNSSSVTGTFADKNVGNSKAINLSGVTLTGTDSNNYTVSGVAGVSANITAKSLTTTLTGTASKEYDANTTATLSGSNYSVATGISGETISVTKTTGTYNNKNVGTSKTITANLASGDYSISGTDALLSNYTLTTGDITGGIGTITAKTVGLSASKTYDGSTSLTDYVTLTTGITGEALTYTGATSNNSHVATASKYISAITLADGTGGLASNYQLPTLNSSNAPVTITAKTLTPTITNTGVTKEYDGTTASSITPTYSFSGLVSGDTDATLTNTSATYNSKDVASANTVTVSGLSISGITGNKSSATTDYTLDSTSKTKAATITAKSLTASAAATNKTYDGTTTATTTLTLSGLIGTETLGQTVASTFSDKNAGTGKTVTVNSIDLADGSNGGLASNYSISAGQTTTANINAKALTISGITASDKDYDGTRTATVSTSGVVYSGKVSGDSVTVSATGTFQSASAGRGKTVNLTSTYSGTDVSNYNITGQSTTTANINSVGDSDNSNSSNSNSSNSSKSRCALTDCNKDKLSNGEIVIVRKNTFTSDNVKVTPVSIKPEVETRKDQAAPSLIKIIVLKPGQEPKVDKEYEVSIRGNDAILKEQTDIIDKTITNPGKSIGSARFSIENDKGKILEYNMVVRESGLEIRPLSFDALLFADKNKATVAGAAMIDVANNLKLPVDGIKTILFDLIIDKVFEDAMFNQKDSNRNIFNINYY